MILLHLLPALAVEPVPLHATGFRARPDGLCEDRAAARRGTCIDRVDLLDLDRAWGVRPARGEDRTAWRTVSSLYARTLEDLARRWALPDVQETIVREGFGELPPPVRLFQTSAARDGTWSLPRRDSWLGVDTWFDPVVAPDGPRDPGVVYPHVRYTGPEGQESLPRTLLLAGRFPARLGFDGKRHDYDLMDGDPTSSGPLFEQLYPYQRRLSAGREAEDPVYAAQERIPLADFRFPRHLVDSTEDPLAAIRAFERVFEPIRTDGGLPGARRLASGQFERFVRVISVAAGQYAMQDFTRNQLRVLTALAAMSTPPDELADDGGYTRDLVAAARGETDTSDEILDRLDTEGAGPLPDGPHLRYEQLPPQVVLPWVRRLGTELAPGPTFFVGLNHELGEVFPAILRPDRPLLGSLDPAERRTWLRDSVLPGNDREEVDTALLRVALRRMLQALAPERRDRIETWMLLDQALGAIASTFEPSRTSTPLELVEAATTQWQVVLALHDHDTRQLRQGLGAVDPMAICSTSDGLGALDEPSFRRITVDQLVAAAPGLDTDDLLAAAAPRMPFVLLDDPERNPPTLTRLVALGDGRDLYRVRWSTWTGWHLLWGLTLAGPESHRLLLRTGAFCDDMVFTDPDLAPTLIRAGLLHANFRPTHPERMRRPNAALGEPTVEQGMDAIGRTPTMATEAQGRVEDLRELGAPGSLETLAGKEPAVGPSAYEVKLEDLRPEVAAIRGLVWPALTRHLGAPAGLLFVADIGPAGETRGGHAGQPRTPYATRVDRTPSRLASRPLFAGPTLGSGWLWLRRSEERPVQVAPAFAPKDLDSDRPPRWSRRNTADYSLTVGGAFFPWRRVDFGCAAPTPGVQDDCLGGARLRTEGAGLDLQALGTLWRHGRHLLGVDAGLEVRLDVRHAGPSWFWSDDRATDLALTLRPAAGLMLGVRRAPAPAPLWRRRSGRSTWGAPRSDGPLRLGRTQQGLRGSLLLGPGFNGMEATGALEAWTAWSHRRKRGARSSFTPWHPGLLVGPFLRAQVGLPLTDGSDAGRFLTLEHSTTLFVGLRTHLRVAEPQKGLPEVE